MQSIDPATGELPEDPFAGFLRPTTSRTRARATAVPRANAARLPSGTQLGNQANIIFDVNEPSSPTRPSTPSTPAARPARSPP